MGTEGLMEGNGARGTGLVVLMMWEDGDDNNDGSGGDGDSGQGTEDDNNCL